MVPYWNELSQHFRTNQLEIKNWHALNSLLPFVLFFFEKWPQCFWIYASILKSSVCIPQMHIYICISKLYLYMCCAQSLQLCLAFCEKPARLLCPWDSPGKNTRMGCYFLLQHVYTYKHIHIYKLSLVTISRNNVQLKEVHY